MVDPLSHILKEFDVIDIYSSKQQIIQELKINDLLNKISLNKQSVLTSCLFNIVDLFGGIQSFLSTIIRKGCFDSLSLIKIYKIISHSTTTTTTTIKTKHTFNQQQQQQQKQETKLTLIDSLPMDIKDYIASYLNQQEIQSLKMVCRSTAIVCLQIMRKQIVTVLYAEKTINTRQDLSNSFYVKTHPLSTQCRYSSRTRLYKIYQHLSKQYNIPQQHQLICRQYACNSFVRFDDENLQPTKRLCQTEAFMKRHDYILFDKRKLTIINKTEIKKYDDNDKNVYWLKQINYFDIFNQQIYIIGYVLWHENTPIRQLYEYLTMKCLV